MQRRNDFHSRVWGLKISRSSRPRLVSSRSPLIPLLIRVELLYLLEGRVKRKENNSGKVGQPSSLCQVSRSCMCKVNKIRAVRSYPAKHNLRAFPFLLHISTTTHVDNQVPPRRCCFAKPKHHRVIWPVSCRFPFHRQALPGLVEIGLWGNYLPPYLLTYLPRRPHAEGAPDRIRRTAAATFKHKYRTYPGQQEGTILLVSHLHQTITSKRTGKNNNTFFSYHFNKTPEPKKTKVKMSFHLSAQNVRVEEGHILRATLTNAAGAPVDAEFDLDTVLGNDNGT